MVESCVQYRYIFDSSKTERLLDRQTSMGSYFHNSPCSFQYALRFQRDYLAGLGQLELKLKVPFAFLLT